MNRAAWLTAALIAVAIPCTAATPPAPQAIFASYDVLWNGGRVAAVVSNNPQARGLDIARRHGIATAVADHRAFPDRAAFEAALAAEIDRHRPDLIVLAGFTRVLTPPFAERYDGRIMNIHPSLLPAFPGLDTHRRALEAGVRIHGCTVHFVTPALDSGPIIVQAAVPVQTGDTEDRKSVV